MHVTSLTLLEADMQVCLKLDCYFDPSPLLNDHSPFYFANFLVLPPFSTLLIF